MYHAMTVVPLQILAQAATGNEAAGSGARIESVWDFMLKGGWMMVPIIFCSLVALTVIIERIITLRRRNVIPPAFFPGLKKVLDDGDDPADALQYCQADDSPIAAVFTAAVKKLGEPIDQMEKHIQEAGERAVLALRKYLRSLSVLASIAPLMGLLGTIFGMIKAFQQVATSGESLGKAETLAAGIYEAMITTAAGLLLAIPVLVAYHWFTAKIEGHASEMDRMTVEFVEEYGGTRRDEAPTPKLHPAEELDEPEGVAAETA